MIYDARNLGGSPLPASVASTEVCIVGGGPAGITLAVELASLGRQVLLLESGPTSGSGTNGEAATDALKAAEVIGYPINGGIEAAKVRYLGGGTNHYEGYSRPLDAADLEEWPITTAELDLWYPRAHDYYKLGPYNYDLEYWRGLTGQPAPPSLGPGLEYKIVQRRGTRFASAYLPTITSSSSITLVHHANVTKLNASAGGSHVDTATVRTLTGVQFDVAATAFVAATGGTEVPRLLLASNDLVPAGLGNENDQVGRYYADHLGSKVLFLYLRGDAAEFGLINTTGTNVATTTPSGTATNVNILGGIDMTEAARDELDMPSLHTELQFFPIGEVPVQSVGVTPQQIQELMAASPGGPPKSLGIGRFFLQPVPNPNSRVTLSNNVDAVGMPMMRLDWQPMAQDLANRSTGGDHFARQLGLSRAGMVQQALDWVTLDPSIGASTTIGNLRITPTGDQPDGPHNTTYHHLCTARMDEDPANGVTDPNCRVHTVDNLYVAGSAVFARPTGYYPTLTIVALALRLAAHLDGLLP